MVRLTIVILCTIVLNIYLFPTFSYLLAGPVDTWIGFPKQWMFSFIALVISWLVVELITDTLKRIHIL